MYKTTGIFNSNEPTQARNMNMFSNSSSLESSSNLDIMRMQEESFNKMQTEISMLQNKIRGLETKLGPSS